MKLLFAATVALSAFLLFLVQPLIGKYLLPWFGGAPGVWAVCLVFFQVALLAGYGYAHAVARHVAPRWQGVTHAVVLALAVATLPITPSERWKTTDPGDPSGRIFMVLLTGVGLPFFVLASTTPLLQAWWTRRGQTRAPYRMYAVSNLASLGALLLYPLWVEPSFTRHAQAIGWSVGFAAYAILAAACALLAGRSGQLEDVAPLGPRQRRVVRAMWLLWPAVGVALLLGTTNRVGQEVAVVPFLWVVPLALYLLSFVVAFAGPRGYHRGVWIPLFALGVIGVTALMLLPKRFPMGAQLAVYFATVFAGCMVCHGEVARLKPGEPGRETGFYLRLSAGGAIGGILVALGAPLVFTTYVEYPLALIACGLLATLTLFADPASRLHRGRPAVVWLMLLVGGMVLSYGLLAAQSGGTNPVLAARRNFYGALSVVTEKAGTPGERRLLRHGRIIHGLQLKSDPRAPTSYYGPASGAGRVMAQFRAAQPRRVGVIGLGAGNLAAWGKAADTFRFYEINADALALATSHFTFLSDFPGRVEHAAGDARLVLEREPDQHFDVLAVDAFSGDAVPVHLLTREAFDVYRRHLAPGGVILVNVTNQHIDLRPVVHAAAEHLGMGTVVISDDPADKDSPYYPTDWMILSDDREFLLGLPGKLAGPLRLWTDERTSVWPLLK